MATREEKITHALSRLSPATQDKLAYTALLIAQRLGAQPFEKWGVRDWNYVSEVMNDPLADADLPYLDDDDPDALALWQELGEDDAEEVPDTLMLRAWQVTTDHAIDLTDVLDWMDTQHLDYAPGVRMVADDGLARIVEDSQSEAHERTGAQMTVLHTEQGSYVVPAVLLIEARKVEG